MTLSQITYFRVLAETLHMRNAAEKLFISQPALSSSIAKLETELHVRLFERKGHRLLLTEAGEQFLVHAEKIHREVYEAGLHMERISQTANTKIRLGCITPVLRDDLPGSMRAFLDLPENNGIEFEYSIENTGELVRRLKNGIYDMLLCSHYADEDLLQIPVFKEPLALISPAGQPAPDSWKAIAALPLIGYERDSVMDQYLRNVAEKENVEFRFTAGRGPTESAIASLVEYGFGHALIPLRKHFAETYNISVCPLPSGDYHRDIFLTTLSGQELSGAAARFSAFLQKRSEAETSDLS